MLQLTVANHPGVMAHVCGLFSRRAYNVDGILCMPVGDGRTSRIWLMVDEIQRLEQVTTGDLLTAGDPDDPAAPLGFAALSCVLIGADWSQRFA